MGFSLQSSQHRIAIFFTQPVKSFVEQQNVGLRRKSARKEDPPLHRWRQFKPRAVFPLDNLQQLHHLLKAKPLTPERLTSAVPQVLDAPKHNLFNREPRREMDLQFR